MKHEGPRKAFPPGFVAHSQGFGSMVQPDRKTPSLKTASNWRTMIRL
jgi:hypothetical protein